VWVTSFTPGLFTEQDHLGPLPIEAFPEALRFKPSQRVEGACASGSMGVYNAVYGIESGRYKKALVVGVEKMNLLNTKGVTHALATASYWPTEGAQGMTFPGLFAEYAKGYRDHYGLSAEELRKMLAQVSALMYTNGVENPSAHFSKGSPPDKYGLMTADAILQLPEEKNPLIAEPLRLHDCSLITDGAAAVVLSNADELPKDQSRVVDIAGIGHSSERLPIERRENMHELQAAKEAVSQAYAEAGIGVNDLDLAEVHDCFTINQLLSTEALGLSADGRSGHDYMEGRFTRDDRCPVNLSGGLKAKGHPVGATGVSMHALVYKQLVGEPIGAAPTTKAPEIGVTLNVGGSAATNAVSVLRRRR
jgi:acetyl-CoA C-acetyltransferase